MTLSQTYLHQNYMLTSEKLSLSKFWFFEEILSDFKPTKIKNNKDVLIRNKVLQTWYLVNYTVF